MKQRKFIWLAIWLLCLLVLSGEIYLVYTSDNPIHWGYRVLCSVLALVTLFEIQLLHREGGLYRKLGWILAGMIFISLVPQFIAPGWALFLWNYTLAALVVLSGLLMHAMVGVTKVGRAFVIFITLCVSLLMILEFSVPLVHKIALGLFVTGALICLHVIITARSN